MWTTVEGSRTVELRVCIVYTVACMLMNRIVNLSLNLPEGYLCINGSWKCKQDMVLCNKNFNFLAPVSTLGRTDLVDHVTSFSELN